MMIIVIVVALPFRRKQDVLFNGVREKQLMLMINVLMSVLPLRSGSSCAYYTLYIFTLFLLQNEMLSERNNSNMNKLRIFQSEMSRKCKRTQQ